MNNEFETTADRPHMPGYGIVAAEEGSGLLPWSWAEKRLVHSRDYWLATVWADGRPHVMPVWAVWFEASLWFSCSLPSRKTRNLLGDGRGVMTTDGRGTPSSWKESPTLSLPRSPSRVLDAENAKYGTDASTLRPYS